GVPDRGRVVERHRARRWIDPDGTRTQSQLHAEIGVAVRVAQSHDLALPAQHLLRQRRTVVRRLCLLADEGEWSGVSRLTQPLDSAYAGNPGADDDDAVRCAHRRLHHLTTWPLDR